MAVTVTVRGSNLGDLHPEPETPKPQAVGFRILEMGFRVRGVEGTFLEPGVTKGSCNLLIRGTRGFHGVVRGMFGLPQSIGALKVGV